MIDEAAKMLSSPGCRLFQFDLGKTPDDEDGICGGSVEFLIETFDQTALPFFQEVSAVADRADSGVLISLISPDGLPRKIRLAKDDQHRGSRQRGAGPTLLTGDRGRCEEGGSTGHRRHEGNCR